MRNNGVLAPLPTASKSSAAETKPEDSKALRGEVDRLRGQLIERERLASVGLLISDIAHEIYNPLAWVRLNEGMLRMMAQQVQKTGDLKEFQDQLPKLLELLKDNEDGLTRIEHVVEALRLMSRTNEAKSNADVNEVCRKTLVMLNHAFTKKSIHLETNWGPLPPIHCNPHEVAQAFMNLVVNASDAVATGGRIAIRTAVAQGFAVLEVKDDGPGIPPELHEDIFEPFFTTKPLGTGLGLPLIRSVAREHGGRVELESAPGAGATFRLLIPLESANPKA